ncbi:hypothetical protein [Acinetobacter sp. P1(2025)]|uniref:hypothetical protein n=1 Tax=Acinetobacter sp. P1(2025) TaxID=3446120 RepID=UPI003F52CDFE
MNQQYLDLALNGLKSGLIDLSKSVEIHFNGEIAEVNKKFTLTQADGREVRFSASCKYSVVFSEKTSRFIVEDDEIYVSSPCFDTDYPYSLHANVDGCTIALNLFEANELKSIIHDVLNYADGFTLCQCYVNTLEVA